MAESRYDTGIIRRCNNSRSNSNTDNASFGSLLEDLIIEILCRLPAKSLITFKCVSRHWYCLISNVVVPRISPLPLTAIYVFPKLKYRCFNPDFSFHYFPMSNPPQQIDHDSNAVFFHIWVWPPFSRCLPFMPKGEDLLDCCNGLFLFIHRPVNLYWLWCRKTCQVVMIPHKRASHKHVFAALAFNPHESVHYRVVRFRGPRRGSPPAVRPLDIFYSETGTWVEYNVHYKPPVDKVDTVKHCINLGGYLYRLTKSSHLLRYDLKEVNVTAIKLPRVGSSTIDDKIGCIGVSLGRLYHARHDGSKLLIWMLSDSCGGGEWVFVHSICFRELAKHRSIGDFLLEFPATSGFEPLAFHPDSAAVFLWAPKIMICYHYNKNEVEAIFHIKPSTYVCSPEKDPPRVFPYSTCLVPLKNIGPGSMVQCSDRSLSPRVCRQNQG